MDRIDREGGALSVEDTLAILNQISGALDAAHGLGLVHRDVKPSNVLLTGEHAYLTDFGLMRRIEGGGDMTRDGEFMGTIEWAAPEQINNAEVTGATDVYALGCVLFACLTASLPYKGDSPAQVLMAHLQEPTPKLADKRKGLPPGLQPVLEKAMAKAPGERFQSAGEMMAAARVATAGEGDPLAAVGAKPPSPPATGARPGGRRRGLLFIAGAVVLLAAIAIVVVVLATSGGSRTTRPRARTSSRSLRTTGPSSARSGPSSRATGKAARSTPGSSATSRCATRSRAAPPVGEDQAAAAVAADHAVLVDGYQLAAKEYADAIKTAQGGDRAALDSIDRLPKPAARPPRSRSVGRASASKRASRAAEPGTAADRGLLPLEHDHRDLPVGPLLIVVVGGPGRAHRLPHLGLLVGSGRTRLRVRTCRP